jgi:hypothetical protein
MTSSSNLGRLLYHKNTAPGALSLPPPVYLPRACCSSTYAPTHSFFKHPNAHRHTKPYLSIQPSSGLLQLASRPWHPPPATACRATPSRRPPPCSTSKVIVTSFTSTRLPPPPPSSLPQPMRKQRLSSLPGPPCRASRVSARGRRAGRRPPFSQPTPPTSVPWCRSSPASRRRPSRPTWA